MVIGCSLATAIPLATTPNPPRQHQLCKYFNLCEPFEYLINEKVSETI